MLLLALLRVGGECTPLSSLLGGVLKGDSRSSVGAWLESTAREAFPVVAETEVLAPEAGLLGIFGLPARLIGGGPPGPDATEGDRPLYSLSDGANVCFGGSGEGAELAPDCRKGAWRASMAGVAGLLCTRKCRLPLP